MMHPWEQIYTSITCDLQKSGFITYLADRAGKSLLMSNMGADDPEQI